jgi:preprotein translocase subunit SecY
MLSNAIRSPDIRRRLWVTMALLIAYRLGSFLPLPGVDPNAATGAQTNFQGSNILSFLNLFSGGGLSRISLFALGVTPYVTASIVIQLLTVVSPRLEKLQREEGERGHAQLTQYTRYLTVGLALAESLGYAFYAETLKTAAGTSVLGHLDVLHVFVFVISLTAGTVLLMRVGELITQRGIGNGISLLIMAGIVTRLPQGVHEWATSADQVFKVTMPFLALAVIASIVFIQDGQRKIPIQYARRVIGRRMSAGGRTYLPLRVNMAGVIPVIFAASLMAFPPTAGQLLGAAWAQRVADFFNPNGWPFVLGESLLILVFTFFYTAVTFNPVDQAQNLREHGGFIPGVRPGRPTAAFLDRVLARLTFPGAIYLAAVAALPTVLIAQTHATFFFGGTSLLIVIGVALDTVRQLEALVMMRSYEAHLKF